MAKLNVASPSIHTHEGAKANKINVELQLRRAVMSCMLWEDQFYESGVKIADRISNLVNLNKPEVVAAMAIEAREKMKLRHVPLLLVNSLLKHPKRLDVPDYGLISKTLERVIQRPDELSEFLAIYSKDREGTKKLNKLSNQVKKGLAKAFTKFTPYQLAKYNRDGAIKLRDVLFLCHAKPKDEEQAKSWKQLIDNTLPVPDTWEVELSASKDKKASWTRLLSENKLGALALLRNLRNMQQAGVEEQYILSSLNTMKVDRVLPYRFIAAAKYVPGLENALEEKFIEGYSTYEKQDGRTILLIDVSGSMDVQMSAKSEMTRLEAACGLAMLAREMYSQVKIYTFSNNLVEIPARRGFSLKDAIVRSQPHAGTNMGGAVAVINQNLIYDRLIVFTDEQSSTTVPSPKGTGYMINVASYKNGVGYGAWNHVDGFSEATLDWINCDPIQIKNGPLVSWSNA